MPTSQTPVATHYSNQAFQDDEFYYAKPPAIGFLPRVVTGKHLGERQPKTENADVGSVVPVQIGNETGPGNDGDEEEERLTWDSPVEFLMSCISMSVGLGNVWRFPGVAAKNGGGAFLIPYLIVLLLIGRPLYYLEMCMGQFSRYGQVKVWNMAPMFKGVGYGSITAVICVCSYYCALMGITVYYFIQSFKKELPWAASGSAEYFSKSVFPQKENLMDGLGSLHWELALCLAFSWLMVCLSLIRGVKSSGKVAYFTAIFPYVVLFTLLVKGATLEGAGEGIKQFFKPEWKKLYDPGVWYAAVEQCFFSLATAFGPVIMFSSYNNFKANVYKDALIISFMDTFTSLLAGITSFSVIGNLMHQTGRSFEDIQGEISGPGLAFILYPEVIATFGGVPQLFAVLFFLMLFTLGIGSATSLTGGIITIICDQKPRWRRWLVTVVVCTCGCLVGLIYVTEGGLLMLDLIDHYGSGFIVYVMAILECSGICFVYGLNNWCDDIEFMLGRKTGIYWRFCWGVVIPVGLTANLLYFKIDKPIFGSTEIYPVGASVAGWLVTAFAIAMVIGWGIHGIVTRKSLGFKEKFIEATKPTPRWGPQKRKLREEWLAFRRNKDLYSRRKRLGLL